MTWIKRYIKVRQKLKSWNNQTVELTYLESISIGLPYDKACPKKEDPEFDPVCRDNKGVDAVKPDDPNAPKLFIPTGDISIFNPDFIRCPERVSS